MHSVNWTLGNKFQWNLNRNSCNFIQENAFENVVWKKATILSRPQCVLSKHRFLAIFSVPITHSTFQEFCEWFSLCCVLLYLRFPRLHHFLRIIYFIIIPANLRIMCKRHAQSNSVVAVHSWDFVRQMHGREMLAVDNNAPSDIL